MTKVNIVYQGQLRTTCKHEGSGEEIETDAPLDNNGKGAKFSPTDLLASAYATCMMTVIGIYCEQEQLDFKHGKASVIKDMTDNPRRIQALKIIMDLENNDWSNKNQEKIVRIAKNCPVAKSVHPDIELTIDFKF